MRIVGINGVWCRSNAMWPRIARAFADRINLSAFFVEGEENAHPWEVHRWHRFGNSIVERHDSTGDILLIGHSLGGICACAIANRFQYARVRGVVTIFSPHQYAYGLLSAWHGGLAKLQVPIVSFEAERDELVWWGTAHPQSRAHVVIASNHYGDLITEPSHAESIARVSVEHLLEKAQA